MVFNPNLQDNSDFFSQEVLAVITRKAGFPWREEINYNDLPPHLQSITKFIIPVADGVNVVGHHFVQSVFSRLEYICGAVEKIPVEDRYDCIYGLLLYEAMHVVSYGRQVAKTFGIIRLISDLCLWLIKTDQPDLIPAAASALGFILRWGLHGGFMNTLERLKSYACTVHNRNVQSTI